VINLTEIDGERFRERTMLDFNSAATLARMPGPKFVFIHIISPHEPFVFDADGKPIDPAPLWIRTALYAGAIHARLSAAGAFCRYGIRKDAQHPDLEIHSPLVIILQTDTAPLFTTGSDEFKILNAYYMPGHTGQLYPGISPVNTFRVVFNAYLGTDLPLLNDASYSSPIPIFMTFHQYLIPVRKVVRIFDLLFMF